MKFIEMKLCHQIGMILSVLLGLTVAIDMVYCIYLILKAIYLYI